MTLLPRQALQVFCLLLDRVGHTRQHAGRRLREWAIEFSAPLCARVGVPAIACRPALKTEQQSRVARRLNGGRGPLMRKTGELRNGVDGHVVPDIRSE